MIITLTEFSRLWRIVATLSLEIARGKMAKHIPLSAFTVVTLFASFLAHQVQRCFIIACVTYPTFFASASHSTETFPTSRLPDDAHFSISGPNSYRAFSGRGVRMQHSTVIRVPMKETLIRRGNFGASSLFYLGTLTRKLSLASRTMGEPSQSISYMGKYIWIRI